MGDQVSEFFSSLHNLPKVKKFNISNNKLNGKIPTALSIMPITVFEGNHLCGKPLDICPGIAAGTGEIGGAASRSESKKKQGLSGDDIATIVIGSVVDLTVVLVIIRCWSIKWSKVQIQPENMAENVGVVAAPMSGIGECFFGNAWMMFDLDDLTRSLAEVLGEGLFRTTYKAVLESGTVIEVKRLKGVTIAHQRFKDTIEVVGAMDHENLLPLRAYCYSTNDKFLVYDYMPMGSLSELLHGNKGVDRMPLNWEIRVGIALGATL
ncbi:hypothetical protein Ancab_005923 [Ancistrocladus abbreviatus]